MAVEFALQPPEPEQKATRRKLDAQPIRPALAASTRWQTRPLITPAQESDEMPSPAYTQWLLYLRVNFGPRPSEPPQPETPKQANPADKPTDEAQKACT